MVPSRCVPPYLNQSYSFAEAFIYNWSVTGKFSFARFYPRLTITNKREITAIKRAFDRHVVIIFRCSYVNRNCVNNAYLKSLMFFASLQLDGSSVKNLLVYSSDQKQNYVDCLANAD